MKFITVLEMNVRAEVTPMEFFNALGSWLEGLGPDHDGELSEFYSVAPNLTETIVTDAMIGPRRVRFRVITSFPYAAFLNIDPSTSQMRRDWQDTVHRFTDGLSLLCNHCSVQVPVAYIPGLLPEHDFTEACREIQSVHIDYSSVPWTDGEVTHDLRIAKVIVPVASLSNARRILGDVTLAIRGTRFTVVPVEELNGPFFANNLRGHVYDQHHRMRWYDARASRHGRILSQCMSVKRSAVNPSLLKLCIIKSLIG
jgi:hypothetical protein